MNTLRAIHVSCVLALLPPASAAAERAASQPAASGPRAAKRISTLYLFVHPMPRRAPIREEYMAKWEKLLAAEGPKDENVICVLSNSPPEMELLRNMAKKYFGRRCIIDPSDNSLGTRMRLLDDLERTLAITRWQKT